jgi:nucleoside-diphosphate-sugar epimerase
LQHSVTSISRRKIPEANKYRWIATDITKKYTIPKGTDVVVHVAAVADLQADAETAYEVNVVGTKNTIKAAEDAGVAHFIFISTASVYDASKNKHRVSENFTKVSEANNEYAKTKYQAEQLVEQSTLQSTILRPHVIYGSCDTSILPGIFENIRGKFLPLPISKSKEVSTTFIGNLCSVVSQIIERQPTDNAIYNLADEGYIENIEFIQRLIDMLGNVSILAVSPLLIKAILRVFPLLKIDARTIDQLNEDSSLDISNILNDTYILPYTRDSGLADLANWYSVSTSYSKARAQTNEVWPGYKDSLIY